MGFVCLFVCSAFFPLLKFWALNLRTGIKMCLDNSSTVTNA